MPTYEYSCDKCSKDIESMHSMTLEPSLCSDLPDCECTGSGQIEKDIAANKFTTDQDFDEEPEQKTGDVVEETIEETKEEVEKQKEKLEDRDFDPKEKIT